MTGVIGLISARSWSSDRLEIIKILVQRGQQSRHSVNIMVMIRLYRCPVWAPIHSFVFFVVSIDRIGAVIFSSPKFWEI